MAKAEPVKLSAEEVDALAALDDDQLLVALTETTDEIDAANTTAKRGYARRMAIYELARDRNVTFQRIAEAARCSEVAVIQALRKEQERRDKAAANGAT